MVTLNWWNSTWDEVLSAGLLWLQSLRITQLRTVPSMGAKFPSLLISKIPSCKTVRLDIYGEASQTQLTNPFPEQKSSNKKCKQIYHMGAFLIVSSCD